MKKLFTLFSFALTILTLSAQTPDWSWVRAGNGSKDEEGRSVAVDAWGNVYLAGRFTSSVITFPPVNMSNSGPANTNDIFLVKYDAAGNFIWGTVTGGNDDEAILSVTTDPSGNVYIAGYYESPSIVFGTYTLTNNSNPGIADMFVVKYNSSGNVQWAYSNGWTNQEWAYSVVADNSGNVYVTGIFFSPFMNFGSMMGFSNSGQSDAFVVKLSSAGFPLWAKKIGGTLQDNALEIHRDITGNLYVTGEFQGTITSFSSVPGITSNGAYDAFYVKYDSNGNELLAKSYGGTNDESAYSVSADVSGNVYLAGYTESPSFTIGTNTVTNVSGRDMLILKFDAGGNPVWINRADGGVNSYPQSIEADLTGGVYISGSYNIPSVTFGSTTLTAAPGGGMEMFLVKYNAATGADIWGKSVGPSVRHWGMALDDFGNIYVSGHFAATVAFGTQTITGTVDAEAFVAKMCNTPTTPTVVSNGTICAGATGTLSVITPSNSLASWYNSPTGGTLLLSGSNTFTAASTGTFYAQSTDTLYGCGFSSPTRAVVTLSVIQTFTAAVSANQNTLTATIQGGNYKWYDCLYGNVISGENGQNFVVPQSGIYAVIINMNGCVDTSDCQSYAFIGLKEVHTDNNAIIISPNPNNGTFFISSHDKQKLSLVNLLGETVYTFETEAGEKNQVTLTKVESGVYFVTDQKKQVKQKIIITK